MPISFNGQEPTSITFNGNQVDYVYYNGTKVWPSTFKVTYSGLDNNYKYINANGKKTGSGSVDISPGTQITAYCTGEYVINSGNRYIYLNNRLVKSTSGQQEISYSLRPSGNVTVRGQRKAYKVSDTTYHYDSYIYITT